MTPKDVIDLAKEKEAKVVDVRFTDLIGQVQHFSIPATALNEEKFEEGLPFDGSSIRGFKAINESDMLLIPDPNTAYIDPFMDVTTEEAPMLPDFRRRQFTDPRKLVYGGLGHP